MAILGGKKESSSSVAKDRLKLVLIHDREGTLFSNEIIEMVKRDILNVISKYIEVEEDEFELDVNTLNSLNDDIVSELVANIPIRKIKKMGKNTF